MKGEDATGSMEFESVFLTVQASGVQADNETLC